MSSLVAVVSGRRRGTVAWLPAPPASYTHTAGAFTTSALDSNANGVISPLALHYPSWQHIVSNANGIFVVYRYQDSNQAGAVDKWRLRRSTDNGLSWTTIYDSASHTGVDSQNGVNNPCIETDPITNDVLVFVQDGGPTGNWLGRAPWLYIFHAADYTSPTRVQLQGLTTAGKQSTVWDQSRGWLWVCQWEQYGANGFTFFAVDKNGNIKVQTKLWGATAGTNQGVTAFAYFRHYPCLNITNDGTVLIGITASDFGAAVPQNYYDCSFAFTTDGIKFYGKNGEMTLPIDSADEIDNPLYQWVDLADATEFISHSAVGYNSDAAHRNWNLLSSLCYNNGYVHGFIQSGDGNPTPHNIYVRQKWDNKSVIERTKNWTVGAVSVAKATDGGAFVQDTTQKGRLFFVGPDLTTSKVDVFYSDDGGSNWHLYCQSAIGLSVDYISAFRYTRSDGSLVGVVGSFSSPGNLQFWRVDPA